jgi:hypothetical protein
VDNQKGNPGNQQDQGHSGHNPNQPGYNPDKDKEKQKQEQQRHNPDMQPQTDHKRAPGQDQGDLEREKKRA